MPPCTGSRACSTAAATRTTWRGAWCAWRSRTWAWPIRARWQLAIDAWEAWDRLGSPEGDLALAEVAIYLALAPRSNAAYVAFGAARGDVREHGTQPVPMALRNAPTRLMKELGYGQGYQYDHDLEGGVALTQQCLPEILRDRSYYQPAEQGLEIRLREKLAALRAARSAARNAGAGGRDGDHGA